jgi:hypothetical protein
MNHFRLEDRAVSHRPRFGSINPNPSPCAPGERNQEFRQWENIVDGRELFQLTFISASFQETPFGLAS